MDGKYRRIKVRLKSDLSAKLDYRTGYYAAKVFQKFTASDKERQLEEALTLGDPFTELPLALEVDYFQIPLRNLSFSKVWKLPPPSCWLYG